MEKLHKAICKQLTPKELGKHLADSILFVFHWVPSETKPKYRNETEIPKRTIKNIGKESNLHLYHWFLVLFWYS